MEEGCMYGHGRSEVGLKARKLPGSDRTGTG